MDDLEPPGHNAEQIIRQNNVFMARNEALNKGRPLLQGIKLKLVPRKEKLSTIKEHYKSPDTLFKPKLISSISREQRDRRREGHEARGTGDERDGRQEGHEVRVKGGERGRI